MDNFDSYAVEIDSECLHQDFDDVDLYAEHVIKNDESCNDSDLILE